MKREFKDYGQQTIESSRMTFRQLAKTYEEHKLIPAEYVGDRKVAGLRSLAAPQIFLRTLVNHFGSHPIKMITYADIEKFKRSRLKTQTIQGKDRSITSVNRELETLRTVLNYAKREGWILRSPFESGAPLISRADEVHRERILDRQEEERLLAVCVGRREHLRPLLIAALDTACRRGELIQMKWSDVDFENRTIQVRAMTTKTARSRSVPVSSRLLAELELLRKKAASDEDLIFGVTDNVKKSFVSACRAASIEDFRFHDCRHTAITRMIQKGLPPSLVMKISGHTQMATFARYVNVDDDAIRRAAQAIDDFHNEAAEK
ncbi:MAG: tyrosine-type recombinase/integrase [Acidobacteria bacterium]|nr:tyrosine-type recombinase/integrase [Acidobacteriota bacterium]